MLMPVNDWLRTTVMKRLRGLREGTGVRVPVGATRK
jgi:hypothetical protein